MTTDIKILIGVIVGTLLIVGGGVYFFGGAGQDGALLSSEAADGALLIHDDSPMLGKTEAPVTIVEFADFQCPGCAALRPAVKQMVAEYPEHVRLVFRHFPLTNIHQHAMAASQVAAAAGAQGKFWEMHDLIFQKQSEWSQADQPNFTQYAEGLGLNIEQFNRDLEQGTYKSIVERDMSDGQRLGVRGTPTLFINGKQFVGNFSLDNLRKAIESQLSS